MACGSFAKNGLIGVRVDVGAGAALGAGAAGFGGAEAGAAARVGTSPSWLDALAAAGCAKPSLCRGAGADCVGATAPDVGAAATGRGAMIGRDGAPAVGAAPGIIGRGGNKTGRWFGGGALTGTDGFGVAGAFAAGLGDTGLALGASAD